MTSKEAAAAAFVSGRVPATVTVDLSLILPLFMSQ
jgi:hypothetical protein